MADGSVTIEATLTKDQFEKGLKSVKSDLNALSKTNVGAALSGIGNIMDSVGQKMMSVGKKITLATAGIVAGLGTAIGRFDTLKNYPKVLSNLGFSAEEAQESINDLSKGIDGLPTSLNDAASGVQRLVAKNGNIKKSTKYFLAMNDAIVAGNAPAEQQASAIEQLTQAYSKGKFDLMEWRTLTMAMPGQLKQVANAMGYVNTDSLYEALKKGKVSMNQFMDKIVELDEKGGKGIKSFQEQAHNSCDSIGTSLKNMKNRIQKGFATILESMDKAMQSTSFGSVAGMIDAISTSLKDFLDKIGKAIEKNDTFKTSIEKMAGVFTRVKDSINGLSDEQLDKIVTCIVNLVKLGPALLIFGKIFTTIGGGLKAIGSMASGADALSGVFAALGVSAGEVIAVIAGVAVVLYALVQAMGGPKEAIEKLKTGFEKCKEKVKEFLDNIQASEKIQKIKDKLMELNDKLKDLKDFFKVVGVIAATMLIPTIIQIAGLISGLLNAIDPVIDYIKSLIDVLSGFGEVIVGIFTGDKEKILGGLKKMFSGALGMITAPLKIVWAYLSGFLEGILGLVGVKFSNIKDAVGKFFTKTIPEKIEQFVGFVKSIPGKIWKIIVNGWNSITTYITTVVPQIIENIKTWFSELPYKIGFAIGLIIGHIKQFGINAWNWVTTELPVIIEGIIQWFKELPGKIWEWLVQTVQKIIEWGTNTYNTATEWTVNTINAIIQWFRELPRKNLELVI